MSSNHAGLVETSNNLAAVNPKGSDAYQIVTSSRSSILAALESQRAVIARAAKLCGASVEQDIAYPGQSLMTDRSPGLHALRHLKLLLCLLMRVGMRVTVRRQGALMQENTSALQGWLRLSINVGARVAGWAPNPSSKVVQLTKEVMKDITGHEPKARLRCSQMNSEI